MSSTNSKLTRVADNIRILSASMVEKAKSGHPGGSMGGADFMTVLYTEFLRYDPDNTSYPYRDRFFLDPGHMSPMLYSTLSLAGYYTTEDLQSLRQWGSVTPGHPEADFARGVENTSGPLGQGHAMALGAAQLGNAQLLAFTVDKVLIDNCKTDAEQCALHDAELLEVHDHLAHDRFGNGE